MPLAQPLLLAALPCPLLATTLQEPWLPWGLGGPGQPWDESQGGRRSCLPPALHLLPRAWLLQVSWLCG